MDHHVSGRSVARLLAALALACLAGCPAGPTPAALDEALAGGPWACWVEHAEGELAVFVLPQCRADEGTWVEGAWLTYATPPPWWYAGPGLYEVDAAGQWLCRDNDPTLTRDELLTLWDPAPCPPAAPPAD